MPIHFEDVDLLSEVEGLKSALIVPCNLCPAVTIAVREEKPYLQLFQNFLKSVPFEQYINNLQSQLENKGVNTDVFRSNMPHQWFMCMWTSGHRKKLRQYQGKYEAIIVLGCQSATETIRELVNTESCRIIEGMKVSGIMNAELDFQFPGTITFKNSKIVLI